MLFFSVKFFVHKEVKGEIGNYFRIFQQVKWNQAILHPLIAYICTPIYTKRNKATKYNNNCLICKSKSEPKKCYVYVSFISTSWKMLATHHNFYMEN